MPTQLEYWPYQSHSCFRSVSYCLYTNGEAIVHPLDVVQPEQAVRGTSTPLPFAVGLYIPIAASVPIFFGGLVRWIVDRWADRSAQESESSPGVLFSSGYIAGGSLAGVLGAMLIYLPAKWFALTQFSAKLPDWWNVNPWPALVTFAVLMLVLLLVGSGNLLGSSPPARESKDA